MQVYGRYEFFPNEAFPNNIFPIFIYPIFELLAKLTKPNIT